MEENSLLNLPLLALLSLADKTRRDCWGSKFQLCGIINAKSGSCGEDCKFCAQSSHYNTGITVYPLKENSEILQQARKAKENGAEAFGIVTSGNRLNSEELRRIASVISRIKEETGLVVCASLGRLEEEELRQLKAAGLFRYHHNIETSRRFYKEIVSTHGFQERIDTIRAAKRSGLEVCSGGIIGMGENWRDRIDMALTLKELDVDSVPINILVPVKGTPLGGLETISCFEIIKTLCLFRIILKDKSIKIAAGRENALGDFQGLGFMAGANGMLIGGYLTVKGRSVTEDHKLIAEVKKLWDE